LLCLNACSSIYISFHKLFIRMIEINKVMKLILVHSVYTHIYVCFFSPIVWEQDDMVTCCTV
jgi:hypothetical protein